MQNQLIALFLISLGIFSSCHNNTATKDDLKNNTTQTDTIVKDSITKPLTLPASCNNDTLNAMANIISGIKDTVLVPFQYVQNRKDYQSFHKNFDKRWMTYDSARLTPLRNFKTTEIDKMMKPQKTLFYPFSGPDILYAQTFFPEAEKYIMIGLEPVGSLPNFNQNEKDSLFKYFNKINTSLNAILKFSFFRTASMSQDLKNTEVDGTLHLLFLFLKRTGNSICSAKPITIDSLGSYVYLSSFQDLKKLKANNKGIEIIFTDKNNQTKTLNYFSLNAADGGLKPNKGFTTFLKNMGPMNTYLKGASYLMHKDYFSIVRNIILNQSAQVIQDDSGIAFHYFTENNSKWEYQFYGQYTKPIPMFSAFYQSDLDSMYQHQTTKPLGFGIGYNFRDKNSNFMIATKRP